jgi:hypothetical protein
MPRLIVLPELEDINCFYNEEQNRSENDENNKIRENIISNIFYINASYFVDPEYGCKWRNLKDKFVYAMNEVSSFETCKIKHMAGRNNNYDFNVTFYDESNNKLEEINLEFKYNATIINDAPQFVSPMKPSQYLSSSFEENYYENYLIPLFSNFGLTIPEKELYLKSIHTNKPDCVKDAQILYYKGSKQSSQYTGEENATAFYESANKASKECIKNFIENTELDTEKLSQYLVTSQDKKIYLLYRNGTFNIQYTNPDDYVIESYIKNPTKYRYEALTKSQRRINILLRWKNGNGIAYPAFQIS